VSGGFRRDRRERAKLRFTSFAKRAAMKITEEVVALNAGVALERFE